MVGHVDVTKVQRQTVRPQDLATRARMLPDVHPIQSQPLRPLTL
jgi:hypothetical protein